MTTITPTTTVVADGPTLDVLHWFRQNQINIENQLGTKVSAMTLTYDVATGYAMTYTPLATTEA